MISGDFVFVMAVYGDFDFFVGMTSGDFDVFGTVTSLIGMEFDLGMWILVVDLIFPRPFRPRPPHRRVLECQGFWQAPS